MAAIVKLLEHHIRFGVHERLTVACSGCCTSPGKKLIRHTDLGMLQGATVTGGMPSCIGLVAGSGQFVCAENASGGGDPKGKGSAALAVFTIMP
jgi:hypothetical protein